MGRRRRGVGRDRLVEAEPLELAEQDTQASAGPDLDDRQCPAKLTEPRPDRVAPGRLAGRPHVAPKMTEHLAGGDLDALARYIEREPLEAQQHVRMLLGYSGWGAQQLESELASGAWLPAALQPDWPFQTDGQGLWRRVLRSLGEHAQGLEDLPPDVSWN